MKENIKMTKKMRNVLTCLFAILAITFAGISVATSSVAKAAAPVYAGNITVYTDGTDIYKNNAEGLTEVNLHLEMKSGAAIRLVSPGGLRFISGVSKAEYDKLGAAADKVALGTLVGPESLNPDGLTKDTAAENMVDIRCTKTASWYEGELNEEGVSYWCFNAALVDIDPKKFDSEFTAQSYLTVTYKDGTTETVYAKRLSENSNVRSIKAVAAAAIESGATAGLEEDEIKVINNYANRKASEKAVITESANVIKVTEKEAEYLLTAQIYNTFNIVSDVNGHTLLTFEIMYEEGAGNAPYCGQIRSVAADGKVLSDERFLWIGQTSNVAGNRETSGKVLMYTTEGKVLTDVLTTAMEATETGCKITEADRCGEWITVQCILPQGTQSLGIKQEGWGNFYIRNVTLSDETAFVMPETLNLGLYERNTGATITKSENGYELDFTQYGYHAFAYNCYDYKMISFDYTQKSVNGWTGLSIQNKDGNWTSVSLEGNPDWIGSQAFGNAAENVQIRLINEDGTLGGLADPIMYKESLSIGNYRFRVEVKLDGTKEFRIKCDTADNFVISNLTFSYKEEFDTVTEKELVYLTNASSINLNAAKDAYTWHGSGGAAFDFLAIDGYKKLSFDCRISDLNGQTRGFMNFSNQHPDGYKKYPIYLLGEESGNTFPHIQVREILEDGSYGQTVTPVGDGDYIGKWLHVEYLITDEVKLRIASENDCIMEFRNVRYTMETELSDLSGAKFTELQNNGVTSIAVNNGEITVVDNYCNVELSGLAGRISKYKKFSYDVKFEEKTFITTRFLDASREVAGFVDYQVTNKTLSEYEGKIKVYKINEDGTLGEEMSFIHWETDANVWYHVEMEIPETAKYVQLAKYDSAGKTSVFKNITVGK